MSDNPERIWACMQGPMVGLFVSGGHTAGWPEYVRADMIEFQGHENKRLIAEVMLQMRWKTDTQQYADKLEAEIERLREALAFYANGMEPFGNTARNALENKP